MDDLKALAKEILGAEYKRTHGANPRCCLVEDTWELALRAVMTALSRPAGGDREALLYLMQQFDCETWQCPQCGHAEDTATMDSADYLRSYLAAAPTPHGGEDAKNAERYRFLRAQPTAAFHEEGWQVRRHWRDGTQEGRGLKHNLDMVCLREADLDAFIDAAIAASREVWS